MLKFAADGILSFSTRPLRLMIQLGVLSLLVALGILIYALVVQFTGHALTPGWASTMVTITFLGGVQLLSLGVLGAYIGRIYAESQNRPLYLVAETIRVDEEKLHQ